MRWNVVASHAGCGGTAQIVKRPAGKRGGGFARLVLDLLEFPDGELVHPFLTVREARNRPLARGGENEIRKHGLARLRLDDDPGEGAEEADGQGRQGHFMEAAPLVLGGGNRPDGISPLQVGNLAPAEVCPLVTAL